MRPLLTAKQVAPVICATEDGVRRLAREGRIPVVRIGRKVLFDPDDIEEWIDQQRRPADLGGAA